MKTPLFETPQTDAAVIKYPDGTPLILVGVDQEIVAADRMRTLEKQFYELKRKYEQLMADIGMIKPLK